MIYRNKFPPRIDAMSMDNWHGDLPAPLNPELDDWDGQNIYIHGSVGTGKTHLIAALTKLLLQLEKIEAFYFVNSVSLLNEIRATFDPHRNKKYNPQGYEETMPDTDSVINQYSNIPLLIIDDIGTEKPSEWVSETFYLILNKRYEYLKPTFATSNLNPGKLALRIGDRFMSRLCGHDAIIIPTKGKDRRFEIKELP